MVTIIGTGNMARGIGTRLAAGGTSITLVGRSVEGAEEVAAQLRGAAAAGAEVTAAPYGGSLSDDIVVFAVPYTAAAQIVREYGDQFVGKTIVDITNPVDFTTMEPAVAPGTSGAEEIARIVPDGAKVVKAFNTTFAGTLVQGQVAGQPLDVLIAGDAADAKARLSQLAEAAGLRSIDAGPLSRARQLEALGLLHMAVQFTMNTGFATAVKILS